MARRRTIIHFVLCVVVDLILMWHEKKKSSQRQTLCLQPLEMHSRMTPCDLSFSSSTEKKPKQKIPHTFHYYRAHLMTIIHLINCVSHAFVIRLLQDAELGACLMEKSALQTYQFTIKPLCNSFYLTTITDTHDLNTELYSINDSSCQECKYIYNGFGTQKSVFYSLFIYSFFFFSIM